MEDKQRAHSGVPTAEEIQEFLRREFDKRSRVKDGPVSVLDPIADFGLDSVEMAEVAGALESRLGCWIEPSLLWIHSTIAGLAGRLHEDLASGKRRKRKPL